MFPKHILERQKKKHFSTYRALWVTKIGLSSIKGHLLRIDLIQTWKAFHSDIAVELSDIFEYARNTRTRSHNYKLSIPLCRKDVKNRSFAIRCVNIWTSIPEEAVASNNVESFKAQLGRFFRDISYETL